MSEAPYITKSGKVLTDEDIQTLANEAERGYDVSEVARDRGELANNVRRLMGMHLVNQIEMAEAIGMTKQGVWQIVAGRNMPRWSTIEKMAQVFGVDTTELLGAPEVAVMAGAKAFPTAPIRTGASA